MVDETGFRRSAPDGFQAPMRDQLTDHLAFGLLAMNTTC